MSERLTRIEERMTALEERMVRIEAFMIEPDDDDDGNSGAPGTPTPLTPGVAYPLPAGFPSNGEIWLTPTGCPLFVLEGGHA